VFRDEYEAMTNIPKGHNAFWILSQPKREPKESAEKAAGKPYMTATQKAKNALRSDEERAADRKAKRGTRPTRSKAAQAAHERQVAAKREAKLARKNVSSFNTQIPDQAASDRTNSIKGRT
jgi:hypothetical protein